MKKQLWHSTAFAASWSLILLILFLSKLVLAQANVVTISLKRSVPQHLQTGEYYFLHGKIANFEPDLKLTASADNYAAKHNYHFVQSMSCDSFSVPIYFGHDGIYHLTVQLTKLENNRDIDMGRIGPFEIYVSEPLNIKAQPIVPISNLDMQILGNKGKLCWDSENELIELQYQQGAIHKKIMLSNTPRSISTDILDVTEFNEGTIEFQIRGARSNDGTLLTKSSNWGERKFLTWPIARSQREVIISPKVDFQAPMPVRGAIGEDVIYNMDINAYFDLKAFVGRPDKRVEILEIQSKSKVETFTTGMCYEPGKVQFAFTPDLPGVYVVKLNNHDGEALLKVPFYCGDVLPILPPRSMSHIKVAHDSVQIYVLNTINAIREELSMPLLQHSDRLERIANNYANVMKNSMQCSHGAAGQTTAERIKMSGIDGVVNENVACAKSPIKAFYNLLDSPSHYSAMVDETMNFTALAWEMAADSTYYLAQYFSNTE
jgi:uncharacterized protein YkwD